MLENKEIKGCGAELLEWGKQKPSDFNDISGRVEKNDFADKEGFFKAI